MNKLRKGPVSTAFGLGRIGMIAVKAPVLSCVILLALVIGAIFGIQRIKIDDSLSQLFRSDTPEFRQFEEVTRRFPSAEYDVLIVVEGKTLMERDSLERLRNIVTDLNLIDGMRGLVSLFSAREASPRSHWSPGRSMSAIRQDQSARVVRKRPRPTRSADNLQSWHGRLPAR